LNPEVLSEETYERYVRESLKANLAAFVLDWAMFAGNLGLGEGLLGFADRGAVAWMERGAAKSAAGKLAPTKGAMTGAPAVTAEAENEFVKFGTKYKDDFEKVVRKRMHELRIPEERIGLPNEANTAFEAFTPGTGVDGGYNVPRSAG